MSKIKKSDARVQNRKSDTSVQIKNQTLASKNKNRTTVFKIKNQTLFFRIKNKVLVKWNVKTHWTEPYSINEDFQGLTYQLPSADAVTYSADSVLNNFQRFVYVQNYLLQHDFQQVGPLLWFYLQFSFLLLKASGQK